MFLQNQAPTAVVMPVEALMRIAPALLATLLAGVLTVRFALPKFRSERWWERKAQVYTDLLTALFHMQRYLEYSLREREEGVEYDEGFMKRLSSAHEQGGVEVRKAAAVGTFLLSQDAATLLVNLSAELDDPHYNDDLVEEMEAHLKAVRSAIKELPSVAKRDLGLK